MKTGRALLPCLTYFMYHTTTVHFMQHLHVAKLKVVSCVQYRYKLGTKDGWAYHEGNPADERMTKAAKKRDIHLTSKSRPLRPEDFTKFDFIIGMDYENSKAIKQAAEHWQDDLKESLPSNWKDKVILASIAAKVKAPDACREGCFTLLY